MIFVVDDNLDMCRSLEALLSSANYDVRSYIDPAVFLTEAAGLGPGVLLLDLRMPNMSGLDVLARLNDQLEKFRTVVITAHGDIATAVQAMRQGARDFLQKPFDDQILIGIIERELAAIYEPDVIESDQEPGAELTQRERQVALALARGLSNKQVAQELGISVRTVEMHRGRAMQRLGCRSFAEFLRRVLSWENAATG